MTGAELWRSLPAEGNDMELESIAIDMTAACRMSAKPGPNGGSTMRADPARQRKSSSGMLA